MIPLLLALLALPVRAAEQRAPSSLPLLLTGTLADPLSPVSRRLDAQAGLMLSKAPGSEILLSEAGVQLAALRGGQTHPVDRAAAGALAILLSEPEYAAALKEGGLPLPRSADTLSERLIPDGAYRDSRASQRSYLGAVALAAKSDPAVIGVLEVREPSLELEGLSFRGGGLWDGGTASKALWRDSDVRTYEHPHAPGALLRRYGEPKPGFPGPHDHAWGHRAAAEQAGQDLALAGAGPRHFGRGWVAARSMRPFSYEVAVRERVYGENVESLIASRRFGEEEQRLVHELLARMAAARLDVETLFQTQIVLGTTLADPVRRAYLLDPVGLHKRDPGTPELEVLAGLHTRTTFDLMIPRYEAGQFVGLRPFYRPLNQIIDAGLARSRERGFWARLKDKAAALLRPLGESNPD